MLNLTTVFAMNPDCTAIAGFCPGPQRRVCVWFTKQNYGGQYGNSCICECVRAVYRWMYTSLLLGDGDSSVVRAPDS